jgi:hypothetical protein
MSRSVRLSGLIALLLTSAPATAADPTVFFEQKIRPVLVKQCYSCHSTEAKKSKGGLLLDTRAGLIKGGESGSALVPGKPDASLLIKAVRYDHELKMPPKGKLSAEAIADLEKWVALGAPDPRGTTGPVVHKTIDMEKGRQFWAYQKPKQVPAPGVKDSTWARSDIDRFILAALEAKGLRPALDADRVTLIRRVYFDLIGLPPTDEQIDAFVKDVSADAFAKVVDELLASKQFGERWGRHWLDVARYSESSGGGRSLLYKDAWRYRDYVINAFNSDKPYDRFIMEQIAGDLLPYENDDQRTAQLIATAFLVLGPTNYEEQHKETLEMDVIDEQLDTMGRVFLGMTIGCARCHDHKFDPIPTKDYYALAGIFKSTQTLIHDNVSRWVDAPLPVAGEQKAAIEKHEAAVAAIRKRIDEVRATEKRTGTVPNAGVIAANTLPGVVIDDTQAKKVGEWIKSTSSKNYIGEGYLHDGNTDKGKKTLTFTPKLPAAGRYEVRIAYPAAANRATKVPVAVLHQDGEFTGVVNEQVTPHIDGRFVSVGTFRFDTSDRWYVIISNEGTTGHVVVDAVQFLPEEMAKAEKEKKAPPKEKPAKGDSRSLEAELKKLVANGPERPLAMVVKEASKIEDCNVCIRGNIRNVGDKVSRGFLQVASASPMPTFSTKESGRRELAAWLSNPDNPLTARVMANRLWHHLHGQGIVRTVDVFGTTGELPSNQALLDHLARRFVDQKWSMKKLIREIVLSHSYQIGDSSDRKLRSADPENRLYGRHVRRRLEAEEIRDTILLVSGNLDSKIGGPNWKAGTTAEVGYKFEDGRRSVYTPVFRNRLLELFEAFDFADPNLVVGRRNVSTVATQALFLMNHPFVMEQAGYAAKRTLAEEAANDGERIDHAYRRALGRLPTTREREIVLKTVGDSSLTATQRQAAWERVFQALFSSIDFRYVN